jgi:hypothetical protein
MINIPEGEAFPYIGYWLVAEILCGNAVAPTGRYIVMITRKGEAYTQKPGFFWANNSYLCHRKKKPGFLDLKSGYFLRECESPYR